MFVWFRIRTKTLIHPPINNTPIIIMTYKDLIKIELFQKQYVLEEY